MAVVAYGKKQLALPSGTEGLTHDDYEDMIDTIEHEIIFNTGNNKEEEEPEDDDEDALKAIDEKNTIREVCDLLSDPFMAKILDDMRRSVEDRATLLKDCIPREDPEYQLILDALKGCVRLQVEMSRAHRFLRVKYGKYYKDLQEFVVEPVKYAKAVKTVGFNRELEPLVDKLYGSYPGTVIAKIIVTLSTASPPENPTADEQKNILEACEHILQLDKAKAFLLDYTQMRMPLFSPNISELVGAAIASQLIGIAGGLDQLMKLPAEHIELLGQTKKSRKEAEVADASQFHGSFLLNCDIVKAQPPDFRSRAMRMVSNKLVLAARIDACRDNPDGSRGKQLREFIIRKIADIMDGTTPSSYHRFRNRKRTRDAQDAAVLSAAGKKSFTPAHMIQNREPQQRFGGPRPNNWAAPPPAPAPGAAPVPPPPVMGKAPPPHAMAAPPPHGAYPPYGQQMGYGAPPPHY